MDSKTLRDTINKFLKSAFPDNAKQDYFKRKVSSLFDEIDAEHKANHRPFKAADINEGQPPAPNPLTTLPLNVYDSNNPVPRIDDPPPKLDP